ncbi:MAG TPA: GTPase [Tepidisphaeraceae bacterium]|jgi:small GTP-binding protein|nr:GTPase [Tepidisphaeraceae bacterium]
MRRECTLLTPPGVAAIAVVRLRGEGVETFLAKHFSAKGKPLRCVHGRLDDIDDPVVVMHDDRQTADVNLHGGTWIVHRFMELAAAEGFEIAAGPVGEGPTLLVREIWASLPAARTELAIRTLLAQEAAWNVIVKDPISSSALQRILDDRALNWLLALPTVAIIGPANAGKSTLANQLFGQAHSIVADLPGTTRDWVGEIADIGGLAVMLVDTPGLRASADVIEQAAIAASRGPAGAAELRLLVLDPTQPNADEQRALLADFPDAIRILNKSDRPAEWDVSAIGDAIRTVATTDEGIAAVRSAISRHFGCDAIDAARPRWWTDRQRGVLMRASEAPGELKRIRDG